MSNCKILEFKINIEDTSKEYRDGLILGLVHSGYKAYFDYDKENVCFQGWSDEVITEKIQVIEERG